MSGSTLLFVNMEVKMKAKCFAYIIHSTNKEPGQAPRIKNRLCLGQIILEVKTFQFQIIEIQ